MLSRLGHRNGPCRPCSQVPAEVNPQGPSCPSLITPSIYVCICFYSYSTTLLFCWSSWLCATIQVPTVTTQLVEPPTKSWQDSKFAFVWFIIHQNPFLVRPIFTEKELIQLGTQPIKSDEEMAPMLVWADATSARATGPWWCNSGVCQRRATGVYM